MMHGPISIRICGVHLVGNTTGCLLSKYEAVYFMGFISVVFIPFDFLAINNTVTDSRFQYSVLEYISANRTLKNVQYLVRCSREQPFCTFYSSPILRSQG